MKKKTMKVNTILASLGEILDYYSHFHIFQLEHHLRFENKILKVYPLWYILRKYYLRTFQKRRLHCCTFLFTKHWLVLFHLITRLTINNFEPVMVNFNTTNTRRKFYLVSYPKSNFIRKSFYNRIRKHIFIPVINLSSVDVFSLVFLIFFYSLSLIFLYLIFS